MRLHSHRETFPFVHQRAHVSKPVLQHMHPHAPTCTHMHLGTIDPQNRFVETEKPKIEAPIPEEKIRYISIKSKFLWYTQEKIRHAWKCLGDSETATEVSPHPIFPLNFPDIITPESHISLNVPE